MSHSTRLTQVHELIFGSDGLTQEEIRHLKILLSSVSTDLIGELPLEIVVLVVLYLPLKDFARCLCVSKVWREQLLSNPVTAAYARHRWPALINGVVNRCDFQGTLSKLGLATKLATAHNSGDIDPYGPLVLEIIQCVSTTKYQFGLQFDLIFPENPPDAYIQHKWPDKDYKNTILGFGKVALRLRGCIVVIDDLLSRTRKVFTPPSGTMHGVVELQELGSRLLIGTIDRLLIAWDHVNNQAYEKLLPCRSLHCATQDNRVAAVLYGGDIVIWTPGNTALQLNKPLFTLEPTLDHSKATTWEACLNVFFNRRNDKTFFLASGYIFNVGSSRMVRATVHELSVAGHIASWSCDYAEPDVCWAAKAGEGAPEPRIIMLEYEFDYSSIFFGRQFDSDVVWPFAEFDKLERRFVNYEQKHRDPLNKNSGLIREDYALLTVINDFYSPRNLKLYGRKNKRIDLDFVVKSGISGYYSVVRCKSPYWSPTARR